MFDLTLTEARMGFVLWEADYASVKLPFHKIHGTCRIHPAHSDSSLRLQTKGLLIYFTEQSAANPYLEI